MYMSEERVKEILDFVKAPPHSDNYGRWGALNPEQRRTISELCNSWLMLNDIVERYRILTGGTFEDTPKDYKELHSEIIEKYGTDHIENKKIEKLIIYDDAINWCCNGKAINDTEKDIIDKINEIIDKVNGENNEQNRS